MHLEHQGPLAQRSPPPVSEASHPVIAVADYAAEKTGQSPEMEREAPMGAGGSRARRGRSGRKGRGGKALTGQWVARREGEHWKVELTIPLPTEE